MVMRNYNDEGSLEIMSRLTEPDTDVIEAALSASLSKISVELKELKGGLSGSQVYRVKATCGVPTFNVLSDLPNFVVKINFKDSFHQEALNYRNIPDPLKKYFARVDADKLFQASKDKALWLFIMEDLIDYDTLYHMMNVEEVTFNELQPTIEKLSLILEKLYLPKAGLKYLYKNSAGVIKSAYLGKMERTLNLVARKEDPALPPEQISEIRSLLDAIPASRLEPPYMTLMHGDLHSRNIMVRSSDLDIKFIDIDNFAVLGDFIYDFGELIVHASFVGRISEIDSAELTESNYDSFVTPEHISDLSKIEGILAEKAKEIAARLADTSWSKRLLLAEARFLLTCVLHEEDDTKALIYSNKAIGLLKECLSS